MSQDQLQDWLLITWPAGGVVLFEPHPEEPGNYLVRIQGYGPPPALRSTATITATVDEGALVIRGIRFE